MAGMAGLSRPETNLYTPLGPVAQRPAADGIIGYGHHLGVAGMNNGLGYRLVDHKTLYRHPIGQDGDAPAALPGVEVPCCPQGNHPRFCSLKGKTLNTYFQITVIQATTYLDGIAGLSLFKGILDGEITPLQVGVDHRPGQFKGHLIFLEGAACVGVGLAVNAGNGDHNPFGLDTFIGAQAPFPAAVIPPGNDKGGAELHRTVAQFSKLTHIGSVGGNYPGLGTQLNGDGLHLAEHKAPQAKSYIYPLVIITGMGIKALHHHAGGLYGTNWFTCLGTGKVACSRGQDPDIPALICTGQFIGGPGSPIDICVGAVFLAGPLPLTVYCSFRGSYHGCQRLTDNGFALYKNGTYFHSFNGYRKTYCPFPVFPPAAGDGNLSCSQSPAPYLYNKPILHLLHFHAGYAFIVGSGGDGRGIGV